MRLFLRGHSARSARPGRTSNINRRDRSLVFERLSSRQLLAGDAISSVQVEAAEAAADDLQVATLLQSPANSPLWEEQTGDESTLLQNDGYGYGQSPPQIAKFLGVQSSYGWTFSGTVVDDKSVGGLTVTFGGLLQGHFTQVATDGSFEYMAYFTTGTTGFVTATVTDGDGLTSQTVSWYVE